LQPACFSLQIASFSCQTNATNRAWLSFAMERESYLLLFAIALLFFNAMPLTELPFHSKLLYFFVNTMLPIELCFSMEVSFHLLFFVVLLLFDSMPLTQLPCHCHCSQLP